MILADFVCGFERLLTYWFEVHIIVEFGSHIRKHCLDLNCPEECPRVEG